MSGRLHRIHLHRRSARRLGIAAAANFLAAGLFAAMIPVSMLTGLRSSVPYLVGISVYALFAAHLSAAFAAMAGKGAHESAVAAHEPDEEA